MTEYEDLTVAELKDLLRALELPLSGKKADLITRLEEAEIDEEVDEDVEEDDEDDDYEDFDDEDEGWDDDDYIHTAKQKPELDEATKAALAVRAAQKKKQPAFRRQEWFRYRRLSKTGWRKPKGMQSSQRLNRKYRSPMARVGYGKVASARDLHPSGFREILVHRPEDLDEVDPATHAARVGAKVGGRKRVLIHERADELGIRVLNRRRGL